MPTSQAKPFDIPKQLVWEAYRQVAANKGAPGVDGVDLEAFGADLKGNLYKSGTACPRGLISRPRSGRWRYQNRTEEASAC